MATKIVTKSGSGAPATTDLVAGELAVDLTNKRLYTENGSAAIIEVGSNPYNFTANHDGSAKLATTATGIDVTGVITTDGMTTSADVNFGDNDKAVFGAGSDLEIYHNATSNIIDSSAATLAIQAPQFVVQDDTGAKNIIWVTQPSSSVFDVRLSYDGSTKLATTATGIDVTGSVTASGTLNFGTLWGASSPIINLRENGNSKIQLGTSAGYGVRVAAPSDATDAFSVGTLSIIDGTTYSELFKVSSAGSVGIGTSPIYDLDILDTSETILGIRASDSSGTNVAIRFQDAGTGTGVNGLYVGRASALNYFWTYEAEPILFGTSATERMRLDSAGHLLLNESASYAGETFQLKCLEVLGNSYGMIIKGPLTSNTAIRFFNSFGSGAVVGSITFSESATSYNTSSDYRLKENVVGMSGATERLKQLKPSRFNFITGADTTVDGFLAHEVQDIVPEAITGTKDAVDADGNPDYQGIDQSKLVPLLVATIQELEARIAALES